MISKLYSTSDEIVNELESSYFSKYSDSIKSVLTTIETSTVFDNQIEAARNCLGMFWENYYSKNVVHILDVFPKMQRVLFGLEENYDKGGRYRDHYVHMFDVFVTGSRIISQLLHQSDNVDKDLQYLFKVTKEPDNVPFPKPYTSVGRLFFLWVLISSFHDIGVPVEHIENIENGLNEFYKFFGVKIENLHPTIDNNVLSQMNYFIDNMSSFDENSIKNDGFLYKKTTQPNSYIKHCLLREFSNNNHSVISAICLFNSFIEPFLIGKHEKEKYDLSQVRYEDFVHMVLEQDISRAALAISCHNIKPKKFPKLFPVDPQKLPLTYLLILCDEIQEAFRHEGIDYTGITKLTRFPYIFVEKTDIDVYKIHINVSYVELSEDRMEAVIKSYTNWANTAHTYNIPKTYTEIISLTWGNIFATLENKLLLKAKPFEISINVYYESKNSEMQKLICSSEWKIKQE